MHSHADLYAKDNSLCTPIHIAAMHQYTDAYHDLMKHIHDDERASIIFLAFEVKCNRNIILEVRHDIASYFYAVITIHITICIASPIVTFIFIVGGGL